MSKDFRPWKIDEVQLLPANVQDLRMASVRHEAGAIQPVKVRPNEGVASGW